MSPILSRAVAIALAMSLTQILWAVTLGAAA
jgi:hypothetical protein